MIRLSVIVPFYNVERFIEQCVRSIYEQDIPQEEYEVICVDDCSPDNSLAVVKKLQQEYPTLHIICHDSNKCQGGARNTGLKASRGRYIWFVDSDDYIEPNCLKKILNQAEKEDLDILQFAYQRENGHHNLLLDDRSKILTGEEYLFGDNTPKWIDRICGPWCQVYSKTFLLTNAILFVENVQYEDTDFILRAYLIAEKVQFLNVYGYNYRINSHSVTQSGLSPLKLAWRVNQLMRCSQLVSIASNTKTKKAISNMICLSLSSMRNDVKKYGFKNRYIYVKNLAYKSIKDYLPYANWRTILAIRFGVRVFI